MPNKYWLLTATGLAALALVLGACAPAEPTESLSPVSPPPAGDLSPISPTPSSSGSETETPAVDISDLPPGVQNLVEQARDDLSQRLDVPQDEISLHSVEAVEWRDSSLGCPQPGMSYLQVITPGYRIILSASGQNYEYHTGLRSVILCEK